jgi:signal transduction histidine kinase
MTTDQHRTVHRRLPRPGIQSRLLLGNLLLVGLALTITWVVVALAGPRLFGRYVLGQESLDDAAATRAADAFQVVNALQFLLAAAITLLLSTAASYLISRVLGRSVSSMSRVARSIAAGDHEATVPLPQAVPELDTIAVAINELSSQVAATEATRRRLLTDLGHELRTPLATVGGYLQAIEDGIETADAATLALLRDQVRRMTRLADDINAVSAAAEGRLAVELAPVALDPLVRDHLDGLRPVARAAGVELHADLRGGCTVRGDADRLAQVLGNVLANALRHTPAGGSITVATSAEDGAVRLRVSDDGEGIEARHLPHLFERFYRGHGGSPGSERGSGVGLAICRSIVEAHGGTVVLTSAGPGHGTTVTVRLPCPPPTDDGPRGHRTWRAPLRRAAHRDGAPGPVA